MVQTLLLLFAHAETDPLCPFGPSCEKGGGIGLVGNVGYVVSAKSSQKSVGLTCRAPCRRHVVCRDPFLADTVGDMLACRRHVGVCPSQAANGVAHNLVISMKMANCMIAQDKGTMKPFISILQCNNLFAI